MAERNDKGQFKKGTSGNPKGLASKVKSGAAVSVVSLSHRESLKNSAGRTVPSSTTNQGDHIRFGIDNLWPQAISSLTKKSPVHGGIIYSKTNYIVGGGLISDGNDELQELIDSANNENEDLDEVIDFVEGDIQEGGNGYLELVTDKDRSFLSFFHKDWTTVRLNKNLKGVIIHPNWEKWSVNAKQRKLEVKIPLYPEFELIDGAFRSICHYKKKTSGFKNYGLPDWIAGQDSANIAWKTNQWNVSRLDNDFATSGVLMIDGQMSQQEAADLVKKIKTERTGAGKNGQLLVVVKSLGGGSTSYEAINKPSEGDWIKLHSQSTEDLIVAHNWFKELTSLENKSGFQSDKILIVWQVAQSGVIAKEQKFLLKKLRRIINNELGIDTDSLSFLNKPPVSAADRITPDKVTFKWEGRKMLGLDFDPEDEQQKGFIDDGKTTNNSTTSN